MLGENYGQTGFCSKMEELTDAMCYFCDFFGENKWEAKGTYCSNYRLCKGDPLSPYLFLLCGEGLSALIKSVVATSQMGGLAVCRNGPKLTHLFFVDDSLIFCRATIEECDALQRVLQVF